MVVWLVGGNSKTIAQHILFLSITGQTDKSMCKHFESVLPLQLLWFVGKMCELCLSSQIGVPSKALGALLVLVGESRGGQGRNNIDSVQLKYISDDYF